MQALLDEIKTFCPHTDTEAQAKAVLLEQIGRHGAAILDRECPDGHVTCSGFILSPELTHTLMAYHLIYQSVGWTGGHADGDADLLGVAMREAREETSVTQLVPLTRRILSIDILPVPPHEKRGRHVAAHLHYNVTYGLIAPMGQPIADKPDENREVRWLAIGQIGEFCTEPQMMPIYEKLIRRMCRIAQEKAALPGRIIPELLAWYPEHHRDLPWRQGRDPYRVWLSEIMLQQTRVEAVKGYYARFLEQIPDIRALSECPEDKLLKLWEGLGYYNRVRNLQRAAQIIMDKHGGKVPQTYEEIRALPGIGDYTAGAVCSICYDLPTPAVDGNVLRVLARVQEDYRNVLEPRVKSDMTAQLAAVYPAERAGELTQAFIEIGATVCIPNGAPHCAQCPLAQLCMAKANGSIASLPVREKKNARRIEQRTVFILTCEGRLAIRRRPAKGLLAGLWELPNVEGCLTAEDAVAQCSAWGASPREIRRIVERKHIFTHITWEMQGVFLECADAPGDFLWASPEELAGTYSLPTAFRCLLE